MHIKHFSIIKIHEKDSDTMLYVFFFLIHKFYSFIFKIMKIHFHGLYPVFYIMETGLHNSKRMRKLGDYFINDL